MRNIFTFLIVNFVLFQNAYSLEQNLSSSEKAIFLDTEDSRAMQWKKIRSIDTLIASIKGEIESLSTVSNVADPEGKEYKLQKSPLGLSNDPIRVKMNLLKAQNHIYLGDTKSSIDIVEKELKNIDPRNSGYISWAYQLLFEGHRQLKNHYAASLICLKMLVIGGYNEDLFPEKWRFSCSMEFLNETAKRKETESIQDFKQDFLIWSNSPVVNKDSKYMILSSVYIALGLRNIYLNNNNAIKYIEQAIARTKSGNNFIARAYLVLALLKYENKNKDESLSIIRFLSDDFKGYGENIKYFEKDNTARQISRLCLARIYASMGNLIAAENWYKDVLTKKYVTGINLLDTEKTNVLIEYAHILYLLKNYIESANVYKQAIQENDLKLLSKNNNDLFFYNNRMQTSNFILAKILSNTSERNFEAESQLLILLSQTETDIHFLKQMKIKAHDSNDDGIENILALASLAEEYGIKSKSVTMALNFRSAYYSLGKQISKIRVDLANSINVADYTYSGINEARGISTLLRLSNILNEVKKIIIDLDSLEYHIWNPNESGLEFAKKNRFELMKRLISIDDDISKYKLKEEIEDKIYKPKLNGALQNLSKNLNSMNAEMAAVHFLFLLNDKKIPRNIQSEDIDVLENSYADFIVNKMYEDLTKISINERYFQLSRSLKPSSSLVFQKYSEIIETTMMSLYNLHKKNRMKPYSIGDEEVYSSINETWIHLFSVYKQLLISVENVKERIVNERKDVLSKIDFINIHLLEEEKIISNYKKTILSECKKISKELAIQIEPRANDFKDYVNIALSVHNKDIYDLKKAKDENIKNAATQRENWLNSLKKSANLDLIR